MLVRASQTIRCRRRCCESSRRSGDPRPSRMPRRRGPGVSRPETSQSARTPRRGVEGGRGPRVCGPKTCRCGCCSHRPKEVPHHRSLGSRSLGSKSPGSSRRRRKHEAARPNRWSRVRLRGCPAPSRSRRRDLGGECRHPLGHRPPSPRLQESNRLVGATSRQTPREGRSSHGTWSFQPGNVWIVFSLPTPRVGRSYRTGPFEPAGTVDGCGRVRGQEIRFVHADAG